MTRIMLATPAVLFLLAALAPTRAGYTPAVGARHPDFILANIADGKPISLSDYRGKKVLLIQFASW